MSDDIDFLLDDEQPSPQQQQHQQRSSSSNEDHFAAEVQDEEEEDDDAAAGFGNRPFVDPDDLDWTEGSVRDLISRVALLQKRFAAIAPKLAPHPLIWVPSSAAAVSGIAANNNQQLFVNGLAKLKHKIDTELRLLTRYLADGHFARARCNNLAFLEIMVRVLEIEGPKGGVLFVLSSVPLRATVAQTTGAAAKAKSLSAAGTAAAAKKAATAEGAAPSPASDDDDDENGQKKKPAAAAASAAAAAPRRSGNARKKELMQRSEVDIISRGGLRWIKIRGSSARNLETDVVIDFSDSDGGGEEGDDDDGRRRKQPSASSGDGEDAHDAEEGEEEEEEEGSDAAGRRRKKKNITPFVQMLARLSQAADPLELRAPLRIPFNYRPELILVCAQQPTRATLKVLAEQAPNISCISAENDAKLVQRLNSNAPRIVPVVLPEGGGGQASSAAAPVAVRTSSFAAAMMSPSEHQAALQLYKQAASVSGNVVIVGGLDYNIETIALDVTTMVSLCSDVCNGACHPPQGPPGTKLFPANPVLQRQAEAEASGQRCVSDFIAPVLRRFSTSDPRRLSSNVLKYVEPGGTADTIVCATESERPQFWAELLRSGEELPPQLLLDDPAAFGPCCAGDARPVNWIAPVAALREFCWIISTISGPQERRRCLWLMRRVRCVDTDKHPELLARLTLSFAGTGSTPKPRQLNVFSVADALAGVAITANKNHLHSSFEVGQLLCAAYTPARALTERKRLGVDISPDRSMFSPTNLKRVRAAKAKGAAANDGDDE